MQRRRGNAVRYQNWCLIPRVERTEFKIASSSLRCSFHWAQTQIQHLATCTCLTCHHLQPRLREIKQQTGTLHQPTSTLIINFAGSQSGLWAVQQLLQKGRCPDDLWRMLADAEAPAAPGGVFCSPAPPAFRAPFWARTSSQPGSSSYFVQHLPFPFISPNCFT